MKGRAVLLLSLMLVISSVGPGIASSGNADADNVMAPPSPISGIVVMDGDWSVINYQRFLNATIYLTGNLTVASTGALEFRNTTLAMNLTKNGQYRIVVDGKFTMDDLDRDPLTLGDASVIKSNNSAFKSLFVSQTASRLYFNNSVLRDSGYDGLNSGPSISGKALFDGMRFQYNYHGLVIKNSGVTVTNSTFSNSYYGIYSYFCNPILRGLTVKSSSVRGIYLYYSNPVMEDCLLDNNRVGIYFQNSEPNVLGCEIINSQVSGTYFWYSSPLLTDCLLSNGLDMEVKLSSFPRLIDTQLNESRVSIDLGFYVSVGRRLEVTVLNESGTPQPYVNVAVLDGQGNPASSGMANESGIAKNLATRERFLTREGTIETSGHTVLAFSLVGGNITYGRNDTMQENSSLCNVLVRANPPGIRIWPSGHIINESASFFDDEIIALGNINIIEATLELVNCSLMTFSGTQRTISVVYGSLVMAGSRYSSMGTSRLLAPSRTQITADIGSPVFISDSSFSWTSDIAVHNGASELSNVTVNHASVNGLRVVSSSPRLSELHFDWCPVGLYLNGGGAKISDVSVKRAREYAVYASQSSATINGLDITNSASGLYSYYGLLSLLNVEIQGCEIGLFPMYTMMNIDMLSINGSVTAGIYSIDSAVRVMGGTISGAGTGIHTQTSSLWADGLSIHGNQIGVKSSLGVPVLLNSSFDNVLDISVGRGSSASLVNCTLNKERTSIEVSGHIDIGNWTHVTVLDDSSQPVPGCNVSVLDSSGRVSGSGMTGEGGSPITLAFRESRLLWNRTEDYVTHTVMAFIDGAVQGTLSTALSPGGNVSVSASPNGTGWVELRGQSNIISDIHYSNITLIAHSGIAVDLNATLDLDNVTLLLFGPPLSNTYIEVKDGEFNMRNCTVAPIRARAPLQPPSNWITYRAGTRGEIANVLVKGVNQVTTYTSGLRVANSTFIEMGDTGIHVQACSPEITGTTFYMCHDGIWSNSGNPVVTDVEISDCAENGLFASGGTPVLSGVLSSRNINGFMFSSWANASISDCLAQENEYGFYMNSASPDIYDSQAINNLNSGFHCQESHPNLRSVTSEGNMNGLYAFKSWPIISDSAFNGNSNGIYNYQSGPHISNCQMDGNEIGFHSIGDATGIAKTAFTSGKTLEHSIFVDGGIRDHISITLPSRAIVRQANISIRGSEIGADAVIEDKHTQFSPVMYGDWLVWQDLRDEDWNIYAYNLSMDSDGNGVPNYLETPALVDDPALVQITDDPYMQSDPDIYGDTIVWTDYRNGVPDIYAYTFSNSTEWVVCGEPDAQLKPSIDGDRIVWHDNRNGNYDIYALNISTGEVARLSYSNNHDMGPHIHGDYVVWYSYYGSPPSNDYSDIMLFDMKTWTLTNINDDIPIQYNPEVYGDTVVWHDNRNAHWEIYSYCISTSLISRVTVTSDGHENFMPSIYGDRVVYYTHNRNTGQWSARMSNLTTGTQTILARDLKGDSHPMTFGQRVAWVNRTGNLNDVYVLDFGLSGFPGDVALDINIDGTVEFQKAGMLEGQYYINGTWLADVLNRNLKSMGSTMATIPISVSANGTGRVTLDPITIKYDIPTYLENSTISNSATAGVRCSGSGPVFINTSFSGNPQDFSLNSVSRPRALNSSFSDSSLLFQDRFSNLTVQNFLHVRVLNMSSDPLDASVLVADNNMAAHHGSTGPDGEMMWMPVTDRTHNITGAHDNTTVITVTMGTNIFADNPRSVDMSASRLEVFSTDSLGPVASSIFPAPGWTTPALRPEISVVVTDNNAVDPSSIRLQVQGFSVFYSIASVPGGYNISYTHPLDYLNGTAVACRVLASDFDGNQLDFPWVFKIDTRAVEMAIGLQAGWNLISLPFDTFNSSTRSVLFSISGKYDSVMSYSPSGQWLSHRPQRSGGSDTLLAMNSHAGYWIHATENCTLLISGVLAESTTITLHSGWNLVGYPAMTERSVSGALWGTSADRVEAHDPQSPYLISEVPSSYLMKPGQGFWVRVPADTVWVVDW